MTSNLVFTVVGWFIGFLAAVASDPVRKWFLRPRLSIEFQQTEHFVSESFQFVGGQSHKVFYVRLRVCNAAHHLANSCRTYLTGIEKKGAGGLWEETTYCENLPLRWVGAKDEWFEKIDLHPQVPRMFDLLEVHESDVQFKLAVASELNRFKKITQGKGEFRFTVVVEGDWVKRATQTLEFKWNGDYNTFEINKQPPPLQT